MLKLKIFLLIFLFIFSNTVNSLAGTSVSVVVTATVLQGENSISVDQSSIGFGAVTGSATNRRFIAGPVHVSYFAGTSPWTIRVYTANPGNVAGLIGVSDPTQSIPLKVWDDNYGPPENPVGHAPDEENTYFWRGFDFNGDGDKEDEYTDGSISELAQEQPFDINGDGDILDVGLGTSSQKISEEPKWLRIMDYSEMIPGQPETWRRLAYTGAELNEEGFPVYLAIDVTNIPPQDYRTMTLTFQIINE